MSLFELQRALSAQNANPDDSAFFLIAGPCVIEDTFDSAFHIAKHVYECCHSLKIPYIFKASYRKANRTNIHSFTGIGDEKALKIIRRIGEKLSIPTLTDVHTATEARIAAEYVDILQIPAFLCRQSDLLHAAAATGKIINIKKGQFLSGESMRFAVERLKLTGNQQVILSERGSMFGYQDLVVDFRNVPIMRSLGCSVVVDCTHSLQRPNQPNGVTGGDPSMIATIAKAAIAVGADGLFIETHPNPQQAKSDGANMMPLDRINELLDVLVRVRKAISPISS